MTITGTVQEFGACRKVGLAVSWLCCAVIPLLGQPQPTIAAVGYEIPAVVVSPGQIVTLFIDGFGPVEEAHADKLPLPTELAGIQVLVGTPESSRTPAPMLSVKQENLSFDRARITIQIPYEVLAVSSPQLPTATRLRVLKDGRESPAIWAYTVEAAPYIVRACEYYTNLYSFFCRPMITHADGRVVTAVEPATAGEVLVMYALGLGRTNPPAHTGAAPMEPLAVETPLWISFDFSLNAPARWQGGDQILHPLYVGAVPGFAGLYQINFRVPPMPAGTPSCDSNYFMTNLTVTVGSKVYDGAGICVQP